MYLIGCDGFTIYDPRYPDYVVTNATLRLELNKADSLTFTIYPNHPNFSVLKKLKSNVLVYDDNKVIFYGRILDETIGWNNEKKIVCEGAFAWLNDSIQRPFVFPQDANHTTPQDYFEFLISRHNSQSYSRRQLTIGTCTVTDPNNYIARSDSEYSTTYRLLKEGLLDTLGGYFYTTYTTSGATINYLSEFNVLANQPIKFGLNMLSLQTVKKGDSIITAVLPLGAKNEETGERLSISSLPNQDFDDVHKHNDIVYSSTAETVYGGRILKTVVWDDVTVAANLLTKARTYLAEAILAPQTVTITAADLSKAGYSYNTFSLGTQVAIEDTEHTAHGLSARYLVSKLTIDLLNPASNKLTLGATTASLVDGQREDLLTGMRIVEIAASEELTRRVREVEYRYQSAIMQSERAIRSEVAENIYTKGDVDGLIGSVSTSLTQTAEDFRMEFNNFHADIDAVAAGADAQFSEIKSYIRFAGGNIELGKSNSKITLKIQNDQIGIYQDGVLITYWRTDRQLTPGILEIPVGGRLLLGNYAFIPRSNGSLDFSWIGA